MIQRAFSSLFVSAIAERAVGPGSLLRHLDSYTSATVTKGVS